MFNKFATRLALVTVLLISASFGNTTANAAVVYSSVELVSVTTSDGIAMSNNFFTQGALNNYQPEAFLSGAEPREIYLRGEENVKRLRPSYSPGLLLNQSPSYDAISSFAPRSPDGLYENLLPYTAVAENGGLAKATVRWSFDYTASTTGTATFNFRLHYLIGIYDFLSFKYAGKNAGAFLNASALVVGDPGSEKNFSKSMYNRTVSGEGYTNLLLTLNNVVRGQTGTITFKASSNVFVNQVPVPAAIWLFGSALVGIVGLGRRKP